jgi:hypothetical protein
VEEYEGYEEPAPRAPAAKSGQVMAIAIVNFVLGGLALLGGLCGLIGSMLVGSAATSMPRIQAQGLPPEVADKMAKEFGKAQAAMGGAVGWIVTLLLILSLINLLWGAGAITAGIGLLNRRSWGRLLALILAGVAGGLALLSLVPVFMGGGASNLVSVVLYAAYAAWVFIVLMKPEVQREFV